jgi:hypothetical protein
VSEKIGVHWFWGVDDSAGVDDSVIQNIVQSCLTGLNNVLLPSLFTLVNNIVEPESGVTILFNVVDNCEQCGQQNIVQSCFHQLLQQPDRFWPCGRNEPINRKIIGKAKYNFE